MKIYNDSSKIWQILFQEEATPIMIGIRDLHDNIMFYLIIILFFIGYFLIINIFQLGLTIKSRDLNHSSIVEFIWTVIPSVILIIIAIPTFKLLYTIDEVLKPFITLKVQGSQWYWTYSILDTFGINIEFTSYPKIDLKKGELKEYLELKKYNNNVCDLMPVIASKALNIRVFIVKVTGNEIFCEDFKNYACDNKEVVKLRGRK